MGAFFVAKMPHKKGNEINYLAGGAAQRLTL
jgi:hypothetical protein